MNEYLSRQRRQRREWGSEPVLRLPPQDGDPRPVNMPPPGGASGQKNILRKLSG